MRATRFLNWIGTTTTCMAAIAVQSGCNSSTQSGIAGFPTMTPQRVPPPGTGSYSAPDAYYRGPEAVSTSTGANHLAIQERSAPTVAQASFNAATPASSIPSIPSESIRAADEPIADSLRSRLRGMTAHDLTARTNSSPVAATLSTSELASPEETVASAIDHRPPMVRGQLATSAAPPRTRLPAFNGTIAFTNQTNATEGLIPRQTVGTAKPLPDAKPTTQPAAMDEPKDASSDLLWRDPNSY